MISQIRIYAFVLRLGLFLYPSAIILDYFYYPEYFIELVAVRVGVSLALLGLYILLFRVKERNQFIIIVTAGLITSFGLSFICFLTGDGFRSPYFVGLAQAIMVTTILFNLKPRYIAFILALMLGQHFLLLMFIPWNYRDLLHNLISLGIISIIAGFIHFFIYGLAREIKEIRGILPICSACKKIRNDEGGWEQIENYIRDRSEAEFSHGICPDCAKKLYPDFL